MVKLDGCVGSFRSSGLRRLGILQRFVRACVAMLRMRVGMALEDANVLSGLLEAVGGEVGRG